jgi:hypothetical protein
LRENLQRIVPPHLRAEIDDQAWPVPPVFSWLQRLGEIEDAEMARVFNMGIGLVLVVSSYYAEPIQRMLRASGLEKLADRHHRRPLLRNATRIHLPILGRPALVATRVVIAGSLIRPAVSLGGL